MELHDGYFEKDRGVSITFKILGSENWSDEMGEEYKEKIDKEFNKTIPSYYHEFFWIGLEPDTVSELYINIDIPINFADDLEYKIKKISY